MALFSGQSATVDNPFFPLVPGTTWSYQVDTPDGLETIIVEVLEITRLVAGVQCAIVRDRVFLDELLIEDTFDWYAQDDAGNVWYMGEDVTNYEYDDEGNVIGTDSDGAFEAGVDGAEPGIIMKATLVVGDTYRQEFYVGVAEDMGEVFALNVSVTLQDGTTHLCLQTIDSNPLDGDVAYKYYAQGIGVVLEENLDGSGRVELLGIFDQTDASLPDFDAATFSNPTQITNTYLPWTPETTCLYVDVAGEEPETIVVEVLTETRIVNGIECVVVRDRVYVDELLIEDTHDWYCQDDAGNVWYMGEEVINYEYDDQGELIGTDSGGAWEAGVDGAEAGILMWASPTVGMSYRQEFYEEEAEDMATVVATGVTVVLTDGTVYQNCLQNLEWTPLEPFALEYKFYAPGVGVVMEQPLDGGEPIELLGKFDTSENSLPDFGAASFTDPTTITNTYFPLSPGDMFQYENDTEDGLETIEIEVLAAPRVVNGVSCLQVRVLEYLDGVLQEDTIDWHCQDDAGNVWYMGEEVINYEYDDDGNLLETNDDGSWEAGVDGAVPGHIMRASPVIGESYQQEFYEDEAEDMGVVVATGVTVVLSDGTTYTNCLQTLDWTPLEPAALEYKFYAPGIGVVLEHPVIGDERVELISGP